jgi:2'-5' RNA ligase
VPSRLFVAVWPPPDLAARLDALPRPDEPGVRWEPAGLAHVTLRFLGDAVIEEVAAALGGVRLPSATAEVGPAVSRLGRSVLCVPVAGLDELHDAVVRATAHLGEPPPGRRFAGHLTLARLRHRAACGLAGHRVSGSFEVTEVALVRSLLPGTPGAPPVGRTYETVARFAVGE